MTDQNPVTQTVSSPGPSHRAEKPLRFYATASFSHKHFFNVASFAAVMSAHFRVRPMDLYIFESGPANTIKVRVNGYEFGQRQSRDVSFDLPPFPGAAIDTFWCKIDEQDGEYAALFLYPSEY